MNRNIGIWVIVFVVLVSSSYAVIPTNDLLHYYNASSIRDNGFAHNDSTTGFDNATGKIGLGRTGGALTYTNDDQPYLIRNFTYSFWLNGTSTAEHGTIYGGAGSGVGLTIPYIFRFTDNNLYFQYNSGADQCTITISDSYFDNKGWSLLTYSHDETTGNTSVYINTTLVLSSTDDCDFVPYTTSPKIGQSSLGTTQFSGIIDEIIISNRSFSFEDVNFTWNGGQGCADVTQASCIVPPPPPVVSLGFPTAPTPATGSTIRLNNFPVNITVNATYANNNITLWNSTGKVASTIIGAGNNQLVSFPVFYSSGAQSFYFNGTNNETSILSATTSITINTAPVFSVATPLNNTQFAQTNITFTTYSNNSIAFNATLYLNGVANETKEITSGSNINVSFNKIIATGTTNTFSINATTWDGVRNQTTTNLFYIDAVVPTIATTFQENSTTRQTNLITGQFNFSDETVLFSWNVTIDGVVIGNQSGLSTTFYQYNLSYNMSGFSYGPHQLRTRIADGHTAEELSEDYTIDKGFFGNKLQFETEQNAIAISKKSASFFDDWNTVQEEDRYSFSLEPNDKSSEQTFIINTDKPIYIIDRPDLPYKSWIVSGNNWIDFKIKGQDDFTVDIRKLTDTEAEVTVGNIRNTDLIEFESIGELNVYEKNFTFYTFNASLSYTPSVIETNPTTFYLTIYKNSTAWNSSNVTAFVNTALTASSLDVNNVSYEQYSATYSPSLGSAAVNNLSWNFTVSPSTYVVSAQQNILRILADNCTNSSFAKALVFLMKEEVNRSDLNQTLQIALTMTAGNISQPVIFNTSFASAQNHSICINPNGATYNVTAIMQYTAPGYQTRSYYILNTSLNNITQYIPLLNVPVAISSIVQVKVYDQGSSLPISGAYISLLRFYPETNSYEAVEIERSDSTGFSIFSLVPYNVFYKFIVNYQDRIVLNDAARTIYTGTTTLPIQLSPNAMYSLQYINQVAVNVSCDRPSLTCSFFWADTNNLVQFAQLNVYRMSGFGQQLIYQQQTSSASGLMFYTITENTTGKNYFATGAIETNTRNSFYVVGQADLLVNSVYGQLGTVGSVIYSAMMLVLVCGLLFIDIGPAGVIIGSLVGITAGALFGIIPITWAFVISLATIGGIMLWFSKS